jgi:hypothetical protein
MLLFPIFEGAVVVGMAVFGITTICGGISRPTSDWALTVVGNEGLAPITLCAKVLDDIAPSPSV